MLRFKLFSGEPAVLEADVNTWLDTFEPDVTQMVQTTDSSGRLAIAFLFEESFRGQERRISLERHPRVQQVRPEAVQLPDEPITVPVEPGQRS